MGAKPLVRWSDLINSIDASPHDAGTAYVAATNYQMDDFRPYLYKTADYGKTWKKIVNGIPDNAFTRVVREDPKLPLVDFHAILNVIGMSQKFTGSVIRVKFIIECFEITLLAIVKIKSKISITKVWCTLMTFFLKICYYNNPII